LDGALSVAGGDEWTDLTAYRAAPDAINVVRIEVMTIGGLAPWLEVAAAARRVGRLTSAHVSDYVHVHLQAASGGEWVERVEPGTGIDPLDRLLRSTARFENGRLVPPSEPGLGIEVDWQAVTAHQRAAWKA
jgi:L-alanine-DL-glutamate epimerase-like enolase superfamily enzyme